MAAKFVSKLVFSLDDVANSERLELAFESLVRSLKVNDSVIDAMRVNEVTDRALFKDLAQDEQQLKNCAKACGIDTSEAAEFPGQREMAKVIVAWRQAKTQSEVKAAPDAAARAHGGNSDDPYHGLEQPHGEIPRHLRPDLCDDELLAKSYYEDFEESLAECSLEAGRLRDVVSEEEAQNQRESRPCTTARYAPGRGVSSRVRNQPTKSSSGPSTQCCKTCGSWRSSGNQAVSRTSPSPLSMTTCLFFSIAGISTIARKLMGSCCRSLAGRTAFHTNL